MAKFKAGSRVRYNYDHNSKESYATHLEWFPALVDGTVFTIIETRPSDWLDGGVAYVLGDNADIAYADIAFESELELVEE